MSKRKRRPTKHLERSPDLIAYFSHLKRCNKCLLATEPSRRRTKLGDMCKAGAGHFKAAERVGFK